MKRSDIQVAIQLPGVNTFSAGIKMGQFVRLRTNKPELRELDTSYVYKDKKGRFLFSIDEYYEMFDDIATEHAEYVQRAGAMKLPKPIFIFPLEEGDVPVNIVEPKATPKPKPKAEKPIDFLGYTIAPSGKGYSVASDDGFAGVEGDWRSNASEITPFPTLDAAKEFASWMDQEKRDQAKAEAKAQAESEAVQSKKMDKPVTKAPEWEMTESGHSVDDVVGFEGKDYQIISIKSDTSVEIHPITKSGSLRKNTKPKTVETSDLDED